MLTVGKYHILSVIKCSRDTLSNELNLNNSHTYYSCSMLISYFHIIENMIYNFDFKQYHKLMKMAHGNTKKVKRAMPQVFLPKPELIFHGLVTMATESKKDESLETKHVQSEINTVKYINKIFNHYLLKAKFIRKSHNRYVLSDLGNALAKHPHITLDRYFRVNHYTDFKPYVPLGDIYYPLFHLLQFVDQHLKYNHYMGLVFMEAMASKVPYHEMNVIIINHQKKQLHMNWSAYLQVYIIFLDYIIENYYKTTKVVSNSSVDLICKLCELAKQLYFDKNV